MQRLLKTTQDGSSTLFVPELNEHYHSTHGALQESLHVFVASGLDARQESVLHVLEYGFGTGLNAWLTAIAAEKSGKTVHYTGLEKYPVLAEEVAKLNYPQLSGLENEAGLFQKIHGAVWETEVPITPNFTLHKLKTDMAFFKAESQFHLIYFDAFAPEKQPELWTAEVFEQAYHALKKGGSLVSYCAKGQFKRDLKQAGFLVEPLPGPPGKREMTRAIKP